MKAMKKRSRKPVRVRGATSHTHIDGCFNPASLLEVVREAVLLEVGREAELGGHAIKCAGGERGGNCTVSTFDGARAFRLGDERVRKRLVPPGASYFTEKVCATITCCYLDLLIAAWPPYRRHPPQMLASCWVLPPPTAPKIAISHQRSGVHLPTL